MTGFNVIVRTSQCLGENGRSQVHMGSYNNEGICGQMDCFHFILQDSQVREEESEVKSCAVLR